MFGRVKTKNELAIATGSAHTSFESSADSDPGCGCLNTDAHRNDKTNRTTMKSTRDGRAISARSIASGWFSPDTGMIVMSPSLPHEHNGRSIKAAQAHKREQQGNSPFIASVYGYSKTDVNVLSAEQMLRSIKLGEQDGVLENVQGMLLEEHDIYAYYSTINQLKFLESGGAFYSFTCRTWMTPYEKEMVGTMANMSGFDDETIDNYVPAFDIDDPEDVRQYTFILQKAAYILPNVNLEDITTEVMSSNDYHKCCQPNGTKIWDHEEKGVFRFTKPIIPLIYRMTIQFRVSQVDMHDLGPLSSLLGVRVDKAILMERTKRSVPPKVDGTAKAKSILCYSEITGGVLVTHATVILNTAIPTVVAKVMNSFGRSGLTETCETAERTRQFFLNMKS